MYLSAKKDYNIGKRDRAGNLKLKLELKDKDFLCEIVANHRNGIDVDKFDYFARDCKHLGIPTSFDAHRLMRFARVLKGPDGKTQIAYHEKEAWNIYELFHTRYNLHKRAYQHRVAHAVEAMLVD
eukprot:Stramenopile-MAST_4_protein_6796